ncbi:MAG: hypothetical protein LC791_19240 [Acidobacteria bacterium]|nr:hypothetical protein [Acidobacteriota bacterium]
MADIDVVKRNGSPTWIWWVLGLVLLAALLMMMMRSDSTEEPQRSPSTHLPAALELVGVPS